ncbi:hypothetical protein Agub_g7102 [Astrephomene gubernaculifera]|uniref:Uncharacterized protein n=1 Tax=Astrephomene gubernaculifera TaxID=47775 RepID=A0AAD3DS96_9CHLO|nr:hypothetical protein Agub_g7102 [Astrephomene gubernaculifera]
MVFSCFACCSAPLVPEDHTELGREELKRLYDRSVALNGGKLYVHGIFARANTRNNNKRVYPKHILEREVARFIAEHIVPGTALGELDHPNYASKYFKCLNLPNVSHQVLEVVWKGDQLWGTIEVLPTPSGLLLWELYSRGVKLGVSSRGWASLRSDPASKCVFVDDDFELITFDFVTEPSTRGAYLAPVQRKYKRPVPDQAKVVAISHLGHGVVAMEKVARVPGPAVLVQRIAELQRASAAILSPLAPPTAPPAVASSSGAGSLQQQGQQLLYPSVGCPASQQQQQQQPGQQLVVAPGAPVVVPAFKPSGLDNLLCFGHYVVHQSAPYLDREQHARDYRAHLVIFTARAHLADERVNTGALSRGEIDNVILNKLITKDAFDPASTSFATRLDQPPHFGFNGGMAGANHVTAIGAATDSGCATAVGSNGGFGAAAGVGGRMGIVSAAAAAAAAETQGPSGIDASYAVVHAAAVAAGQRISGAGGGAGLRGAAAAAAPNPTDLESWVMHPHALNASSSTIDTAVSGGEQRNAGSSGGGAASHSSKSLTPPAVQCIPVGAAASRGGGGGGASTGPRQSAGTAAVATGLSTRRLGGGGGSGGPAGAELSAGGLDDEQLRSWLSQLPGGESMAQGFMEIRASLISFAQLYQLHQKRVEAVLLKQMAVPPASAAGHGYHHGSHGGSSRTAAQVARL